MATMEHTDEYQERATAMERIASGSAAEGVGGAGAIALAIIGLAGVVPGYMVSVATIAIGAALLLEGSAISARYTELRDETSHSPERSAQLAGGKTAEFLGGVGGIVLGILALGGIGTIVLTSVAAIVFGGALLFGAGATARVSTLAAPKGRESTSQAVTEVISAAAGAQVFIGVGSVTLGILALVGLSPTILALVAMLSVGAGILFSGSALARRMMNGLAR